MATEDGRVTLAGIPWFAAPSPATLLLVAWRPCSSTCASRAPPSTTCRLQGRTISPSARNSRARSCTRCAAASSPACARSPYAVLRAVDTTPLWLLALCELTMWTDLESFDLMHTAVEAAVAWLTRDGDVNGDGFVEYARSSRARLLQQGWRNAGNAVVHATAPSPGVRSPWRGAGYVYYARRRLAAIYGQLGDVERAERMAQEARDLKRRFNEAFWMEDEQFFAHGPRRRETPGQDGLLHDRHCLWSRIVPTSTWKRWRVA